MGLNASKEAAARLAKVVELVEQGERDAKKLAPLLHMHDINHWDILEVADCNPDGPVESRPLFFQVLFDYLETAYFREDEMRHYGVAWPIQLLINGVNYRNAYHAAQEQNHEQ